MTFGIDHEIWQNLNVGASIGVFACAQYPGWSCEGSDAELLFERFFEPALII